MIALAASVALIAAAGQGSVAAASVALVAEDRTALRAAPHDNAAAQAFLLRGDVLEVRGEEPGFLKVYDHRRERPGYVRPALVRIAPTAPGELRSIVRFLRHARGMESLGIAYAALALRAGQDAETYAAIGEMAERVAARGDLHREVVEAAGVRFVDVEKDGRVQSCTDGDAFRRVLSLPGASAADQAQAALALTSGDCVDTATSSAATKVWNEWRLEVLGHVEGPVARVRLRRVEALAALAYRQAREGDGEGAALRAEAALRELQLVDRGTLADEELPLHAEAAVRLAAVRWAAERAPDVAARLPHLEAAPSGKPGETCLRVVEGEKMLREKCTNGLVWPSSLRRTGAALTAQVQLTPSWTELWVFRKFRGAWRVDPIAPAVAEPSIGYAEAAGASPAGDRLLIAREALVGGRLQRRFTVVRTNSLRPVADSARPYGAFGKWSAPSWRGRTLALR